MADDGRQQHLARLGRALDEAVELLERVGERRWGPWLRARRATLAVDPVRVVTALVGSTGWSRFVLDPADGHDLDDDDVRSVNDRLDRLRTVIATEAAACAPGATRALPRPRGSGAGGTGPF